jgi:small subunit ribosomal protein S2
MKIPTINELFESGVHFGHQVRRWHPSMGKFIYTAKNGIHIIDLEKTQQRLEAAANHLHEIAKKGGKIVFVGTKKQSRDIIELEAKRCGALYVTDRWLGGTISNLGVIKKSVKKLTDYIKGKETGEFGKYTKKERLLIDREVEKLTKKVGGLIGMNEIPQALFVIDPKREKTAIREARQAGLKVVSLIDTNADVRDIDFPIPGNDDAIKSAAIIVKTLADAIEEGYSAYAKSLTEVKPVEKKEAVAEKTVAKKEETPVNKVEAKPVVKAEEKKAPVKATSASKAKKETKDIKSKVAKKGDK